MGVINVTPDSFSDGGYFDTTEKAIEQARRLIQEGADILDIGGESTRPGSRSVGGDEELLRVMPVIEFALSMDIPVSVDTSKPEVMRATIDAGVDLVNDINALRAPGALDVVADSAVMICLMHMQGKPETMQHNPQYSDVVAEVISFLEQRVAAAVSTGIERSSTLVLVSARHLSIISCCCVGWIVLFPRIFPFWQVFHANPCWERSRVMR